MDNTAKIEKAHLGITLIPKGSRQEARNNKLIASQIKTLIRNYLSNKGLSLCNLLEYDAGSTRFRAEKPGTKNKAS